MSSAIAPLLHSPGPLTFGGGVVFVVAGLLLRIRLSRYAIEAEESVKERSLTEDQARRRLSVLTFVATAAMILGFAACVVALRR